MTDIETYIDEKFSGATSVKRNDIVLAGMGRNGLMVGGVFGESNVATVGSAEFIYHNVTISDVDITLSIDIVFPNYQITFNVDGDPERVRKFWEVALDWMWNDKSRHDLLDEDWIDVEKK